MITPSIRLLLASALVFLWTSVAPPSVPYARAATIAKGSRVCDTDDNSLAPKDSSYTLASKTQIMIYAGGVDANDSKLENESPHVWKFRRVGGTWANITTTSEVKLANANALTHGTSVTSANRRATQGDPETFVVAGKEFETSSSQDISSGVQAGEITESQVALSFADAPDDQEYEFACEWDNDASPLLIVYTARISTPSGIIPTRSRTWGAIKAIYDLTP